MQRRRFLFTTAGVLAILPQGSLFASDDRFGASKGYPSGWAPDRSLTRDPLYRVGNYSGGFERMLPFRLIPKSINPSILKKKSIDNFKYRSGFSTRTVKDFLDRSPTTGLLICKGDQVLVEEYRFGRTDTMRLTGWSMAKSITSLLLGICIDRKLIKSYDDSLATYLPELSGTLHGEVTLRNLSNMSSGAAHSWPDDNVPIYRSGLLVNDSSIRKVVSSWNQRREEQGSKFDYNELCPLAIGMVIRKVTGLSLSEFMAEALWDPLGAEADATWWTDSERNEFNCVGYAATLRDWGRLGLLVANKGRVGEKQLVSEAWIRECTSWGPQDKHVRFNIIREGLGYKGLFWHWKSDGSRPFFNGVQGQRVIVDLPSGVVLVHTALDNDPRESDNSRGYPELHQMIDSAAVI